LVSPADSTTDLSDLILRWKPIENASAYMLEFSYYDPEFNNPRYSDSTITTSFFDITSRISFLNGGDYHWRVRAKNEFGWGEYSSTWLIRHLGLGVLENASKFKLENSPNPFEKATTIKFTLLKDQNATLCIYNAAGKEVFTTLLKDAHEGENSFIWNASGFENGVYYYAIEADGMKGVRPMILVK